MPQYGITADTKQTWPQSFSIWRLLKMYWRSGERNMAYVFIAAILSMTIFLVGFDVVFNYWYNYFYNALQAYDLRQTLHLLGIFCFLAALYIILQVYRFYITQIFGLRWRRWLTEQLIGRWLDQRGYYYLEHFDVKVDNPDQRIQEDVSSLINLSITLLVGLVAAVTTFPAFVYILWSLSGVMTLSLGSLGTWHLHGYLVWIGLIYNIFGTWFTFKIGRPLVHLNFEQQRREANFRYAAVDLRTHSEDVALYAGEHHQKNILSGLFGRVFSNWYAIISRQKKLLWFTAGFTQASVLLPFAAALPNYFNKVFLLGGLMQSIRAFSSMQESLSYIINAYTDIASWRATSKRLTTFLDHLHDAQRAVQVANQVVKKTGCENSILTSDINVSMPGGEPLLTAVTQKFEQGRSYVIKGRSGIGKSTFLRVLAGIWPFARGELTLPQDKKMMFLPQKPYMPIGTLADAILFPDKTSREVRTSLEGILRDCHLEYLIPKLDKKARWSEVLSPGEQQRIAFARILVHHPDWVFLDETTSMLDVVNEAHLYELLKKRLPHLSIISIGHHASVDKFHDEIINMEVFSHQKFAIA